MGTVMDGAERAKQGPIRGASRADPASRPRPRPAKSRRGEARRPPRASGQAPRSLSPPMREPRGREGPAALDGRIVARSCSYHCYLSDQTTGRHSVKELTSAWFFFSLRKSNSWMVLSGQSKRMRKKHAACLVVNTNACRVSPTCRGEKKHPPTKIYFRTFLTCKSASAKQIAEPCLLSVVSQYVRLES